jgi:lipoprotein-anchoring transpeptidase ErfK/SrfK
MPSRKKSFLVSASLLLALTTLGLVVSGIGEVERSTRNEPDRLPMRARPDSDEPASVEPAGRDERGTAKIRPANEADPSKGSAELAEAEGSSGRSGRAQTDTASTISDDANPLTQGLSKVQEESKKPLLEGPDLDEWLKSIKPLPPPLTKLQRASIRKKYPLVAQATAYRAKVYSRPSYRRTPISYVRRGTVIRIKSKVVGSGCPDGTWYKEQGGGYICTSKGFAVAKTPDDLPNDYVACNTTEPLPYRYAEAVNDSVFRYERIPTKKEEEAAVRAAEKDDRLPRYVDRQMSGDFFLALDRMIKRGSRTFYRTITGRYVRTGDVKMLRLSQMHGEILGHERKLPIAFVYKKQAKVYEMEDGQLTQIGTAAKHARFSVRRTRRWKGKRLVYGPEGMILRRSDVRLARAIKRPKSIPARRKWLHIDLSEQTLIAYRNRKPVFATLVSTGVKGRDTPLGVYRINYKQLTTTMSGTDEKVGWYDVAEVPWTMYYRSLYAIHGAYWHNNFGKKQSHGCTNLAPADARWLFYWSDPEPPDGWHSVRRNGTYVIFTS